MDHPIIEKMSNFLGWKNLSSSTGIKIKIYKKGKPVERRRRKTTGLKPKGYDRRVAECCTENAPLGKAARRRFYFLGGRRVRYQRKKVS
jgi:hypothetical protein